MTSFDESQHPRAHDGTFTEKALSAPEATLDFDVAEVVSLTPEEVRTLEFSKLALGMELGEELMELSVERDGSRVYTYATYQNPQRFDNVILDPSGDVRGVIQVWKGDREVQPQMIPQSELSMEAQRLQGIIDRARLGAAGIALQGDPDNDGGHRGLRAVGAKGKGLYNATEISKLIRTDIKKAKQYGALPDDLDVRVTTDKFAGGQAIRVTITNLTDDVALVPGPDIYRPSVASPLARRLTKNLQTIGAQYNDTENDSSVDYFSNKFYFNVDIDDDSTRRWRAEEKARKAAKR